MGGIAGPIQQAGNTAEQFPQQPGQVQPIENFFAGLPLNDPLNRGGMPFQGFNPAGTDAGPRPFESPYPLNPMQVQPGSVNPQLDAMKQMFQGQQQPQTQPMNPYEGMTQVGPGSYERLDGSPGSMQPSTSMTPLQKSMMDRYNPQRPQPQTQPFNPYNRPGQPPPFPRPQPQDSKRGLGGLQLNKFRNRLGQR